MDRNVVRVSDVMEQDYVVIDGLATVAEALGMLRENGARVVIVGKRHEDDEFGIVVTSDIAKKVLAPRPRAGANQRLRDHGQAGAGREVADGHPLLRPSVRALRGRCRARHRRRPGPGHRHPTTSWS